jgi:aminoglycoside phosphotransferase (APT) family kinase protein
MLNEGRIARMAHVDLSRDPGAVRRVLLALGLAREDEPVHATALTGGVSSGIYRVDLASGRYCIKQALPQLKVAKLWQVPVERVFSEIAYLRTVAAIVPGHVPRVLGEDAQSGSFVMPFLGPEYRNWKGELLAGRVAPEVAGTMGALLGRIHAATADRPEIAARFATDANFHALRLEPYLLETARVHPALTDRLHAIVDRTAGTRRVLVHGDVSPKNILLGPDGPVLLDAECAWFGDPAFDLAFCLNHFLLKAAHAPGHASLLMRAFTEFAQAYGPHVAWEAQAALEHRVATLLPGLTLARVDGKSPVEYLGDPQRATVRHAAIALLQEPPPSLASLADRWVRLFTA